MSRPRAAVDSGSNSTRLLVVTADGHQLERRTTITRLGRGVDETGRLDDASLRRTLDVIADYREVWERHGVTADAVRIAATSAVRDASDRDRYFAGVRDRTGVDAEVLAGDEEAALSFRGAVGALEVDSPAAVVDIGGGSTEIVVGDGDRAVRGTCSMQLGSVRVTERHLIADPPTPAQVTAARAMIDEALVGADAVLADQGAVLAATRSLLGVAGTVTTIAALQAGVDREEEVHGLRMSAADVRAWADRLLAMPVADRRALPAIPAGREDVIAAGALILAEVVARHPSATVVVSTADILDGLVASIGD